MTDHLTFHEISEVAMPFPSPTGSSKLHEHIQMQQLITRKTKFFLVI